jgi:hypothetical protein
MRSAAGLRRALPLGSALLLLLAHAPAHAALRNPQVHVNGAGLQWYLDWVGDQINVQTDQQDVQVFEPVMSSNSTTTYSFETGPKDSGLEVGIYDGHLSTPDLVPVFPASSGPGWFAVASFRRNPDRVVINLFDASANLEGTVTHLGIAGSGFGFYVRGPGGTLYSQDVRNPGGAAQALFFAGTGIDSGSWWICLESAPQGVSDQDFDDAILFNETVVGLPVHKASWGELKARFR